MIILQKKLVGNLSRFLVVEYNIPATRLCHDARHWQQLDYIIY
jgi:hypothetical protein